MFMEKGPTGSRLYYLLWQWGAYHFTKKIHRRENFERIHHLTFGVVRQPSFMGRLGAPFIFGPVGGGETTPWRLRFSYNLGGWFVDAVRDMANWIIRIDPLMYDTFRRAETIYVKTPASRSVIPKKFWSKVRCQLEIGITLRRVPFASRNDDQDSDLRILYIGRFLYWKGMHLGLRAFAQLLQVHPHAELTLIGSGPERERLRTLAQQLDISKQLSWIGWMKQDELDSCYVQHDVFLFPSLHDSSGNVALEALAHGVPVVCLKLGGPAILVDETCGRVVSTTNASSSDVINSLAQALIEIAESSGLRKRLTAGALSRASKYDWKAKIETLSKIETCT